MAPLFTETAISVTHTDAIQKVNDFNRQPLLIHGFSKAGPAMAKADFNKDGKEDIVIGGAKGQATSLFLQDKDGKFQQKTVSAFERDRAFQDAAIAALDANGDGYPDIYIASGGYHDLEKNDPLLADRLYINDGKGGFIITGKIPDLRGSKSCVAAGDFNGDGFADLFVGGRVVPGRYPETPSSYLLISDGKGTFTDQTATLAPSVSSLGMVTDAEWIDLDNDNMLELVVVGEWMPLQVFKKEGAKLADRTSLFFDKAYKGWWNCLEVSDLNNDGKPDIVAGNLGTNTQFRVSEKQPLELYFGDIDANGIIDPVLSFYIQGKRYPYITRDELLAQVPSFRKRFSTFSSYADVTLDDLLTSDQQKNLGHLLADHMETAVFLSGTGKYKAAALPDEVQYAPVHSVIISDLNKDGHTDILFFGNDSRMKIRLGKWDANYGTLVLGDGKGKFNYLSQPGSGFMIHGDVRSSILLGDIVLAGVNGGKLVSYKRNETAK
jgi:hypothetical protein